jgi:hypothetical protein
MMREHVINVAVFTPFCSLTDKKRGKNEQTRGYSSFLGAFLVKALPIRMKTPPQSTAPMIADA